MIFKSFKLFVRFILFFSFLFFTNLKAEIINWKKIESGKGSGNSRLIKLPETVLEGKKLRMNHWDSCWQKGKGPDHCLNITDEISRLDSQSIKFESHPGDCGLYRRSNDSKNSWNNCYEGARRVFIGTKQGDWGSKWHSFSFYIPENYIHSNTPLIFNQLHRKGKGAHYRVGISPDGILNIQLRGFGHDKKCIKLSKKLIGKNICRHLGKDYYDPPFIDLKHFSNHVGMWKDFIVNVPNKKSLIIWLNGVKVVDFQNKMPSNSSFSSTNFGIYQPNANQIKTKGKKTVKDWEHNEASTIQIIYIDEIRFAKECSGLNLKDLGYNCNNIK